MPFTTCRNAQGFASGRASRSLDPAQVRHIGERMAGRATTRAASPRGGRLTEPETRLLRRPGSPRAGARYAASQVLACATGEALRTGAPC